MDERLDWEAALAATGVTVKVDRSVRLVALRYFDAGGFGERLRTALGEGIPAPLGFNRGRYGAAEDPFMLVWRSPTECWLLSATAAPIEAISREIAGFGDACLIDQTGGILALRVEGSRTLDLLHRLGSVDSVPRAGAASTGRFADISVTAVGLATTEFLMLVERGHVVHLLGWIRETLTDF